MLGLLVSIAILIYYQYSTQVILAMSTASLLKGSTFRASQRTGRAVIHAQTPVSLEKIVASLDPITGEAEFIKQPETLEAQIRDEPFSKGTMKLAFDVSTIQPLVFSLNSRY